MGSLPGFALRIAFLVVIFCMPAKAQEVEVATSVVCDTQTQVELFVSHFDGDAQIAIGAVNAEVNNPTACLVAKVAHVRGLKLSQARKHDATFEIVKILVLGIETPAGMQPIAPHVYFGALKVAELDA